MNKTTIFALALVALTAVSAAALPFNDKLSAEDLETINKGEVLIKSIDKYKNMSIDSDNPGAERIRLIVNNLNPNYLAEIIQVKPIKGNEDLDVKISAVLEDVESYAGIPYWSVYHNRYFNLYDTAKINSITEDNNSKLIDSTIDIGPFGLTNVPINIEKNDNFLLYQMTNNQNLNHMGITCVQKKNMKSLILLFKDGDNWVLYGIGAVKAPKLAMFEKRIERSFINKTKTFCSYVFSKI
ncbi:MAG: DUF6675 family protein [Treponema sp.]|nr:DUF6675 family protein [Treponema sp.]